MKVYQFSILNVGDWDTLVLPEKIQEEEEEKLLLVFGDRFFLEDPIHYQKLKAHFPYSEILMGSTSGQIIHRKFQPEGLAVTVIKFEKTNIKSSKVRIKDASSSYLLGSKLVDGIPKEGLRHIFVLSDGHNINGSELVAGMNDKLSPNVGITGGMAGDGERLQKTLIGLNAQPEVGVVAAIGFYGDNLHITYGSEGGWDSFGPDRIVTKSHRNVLYELDGESALGLYKKYLGHFAQDLPGSAFWFPLLVRTETSEYSVVRTILAIDESDQAMIFAGNIPEGALARFMKSSVERLIDGACDAATDSRENLINNKADLSIMISCVGRKIVLDQQVEEEIENAHNILGSTLNTGFYSYGEICPRLPSKVSELHNQSMTITTFTEL